MANQFRIWRFANYNNRWLAQQDFLMNEDAIRRLSLPIVSSGPRHASESRKTIDLWLVVAVDFELKVVAIPIRSWMADLVNFQNGAWMVHRMCAKRFTIFIILHGLDFPCWSLNAARYRASSWKIITTDHQIYCRGNHPAFFRRKGDLAIPQQALYALGATDSSAIRIHHVFAGRNSSLALSGSAEFTIETEHEVQ